MASTAVDSSDGDSSGGGSSDGSDGSGSSSTGGIVECPKRLPDVGPISRGCMMYAELMIECYGGPVSPECVTYAAVKCQYMVNYDTKLWGKDCGAAYDELYACFSELTCRQLDAGGVCDAEATMLMTACAP